MLYGAVPPAIATSASPSGFPQVASSCVMVKTIETGSLMVALSIISQPFASVTVTSYVPSQRVLIVAVVARLLHAYE